MYLREKVFIVCVHEQIVSLSIWNFFFCAFYSFVFHDEDLFRDLLLSLFFFAWGVCVCGCLYVW